MCSAFCVACRWWVDGVEGDHYKSITIILLMFLQHCTGVYLNCRVPSPCLLRHSRYSVSTLLLFVTLPLVPRVQNGFLHFFSPQLHILDCVPCFKERAPSIYSEGASVEPPSVGRIIKNLAFRKFSEEVSAWTWKLLIQLHSLQQVFPWCSLVATFGRSQPHSTESFEGLIICRQVALAPPRLLT